MQILRVDWPVYPRRAEHNTVAEDAPFAVRALEAAAGILAKNTVRRVRRGRVVARCGKGRHAELHLCHQWLVLAAFWREKAGGARMSSVMWRRAAAKCSNGGLRAPSRRREARSELAQLPRRASPPVLSLCLQPEGGMGGTLASPRRSMSSAMA